MKNKLFKLLLVFLILVLLASCNVKKSDTPAISLSPTDTDIQIESNGTESVMVNLITSSRYNNYSNVKEIYLDKYDLNVVINNYAGIYHKLSDERVVLGNLYLEYDAYDKDAIRDGIYLFNNHQFYQYILASNNEYMVSHFPDEAGALLEAYKPFDELRVTGKIEPDILELYSIPGRGIMGLPFEYIYPEPKIRKYNKDIMEDLNTPLPSTTDELMELLKKVKSNTDIPEVLPNMVRGNVFKGFEDIVNSFGLKTSLEFGSFYSIQYDYKNESFVDLAFSDAMFACIEYFTELINEGIIRLDAGNQSDNFWFYSDKTFSVYDYIEYEEDIKIPHTSKLFTEGYTPKLFYMPSRYVYVIGKDQELDSGLEQLLLNLYTDEEFYLTSLFGVLGNDYELVDGRVVAKSISGKQKNSIIGALPYMPMLQNPNSSENLESFRNQITSDNLQSGYYQALTPEKAAMEILCDVGCIEDLKINGPLPVVYDAAHLFYNMLSDHFYNTDRPATDVFLNNYRDKMRELFKIDIVRWYFSYGEFLVTGIETNYEKSR